MGVCKTCLSAFALTEKEMKILHSDWPSPIGESLDKQQLMTYVDMFQCLLLLIPGVLIVIIIMIIPEPVHPSRAHRSRRKRGRVRFCRRFYFPEKSKRTLDLRRCDLSRRRWFRLVTDDVVGTASAEENLLDLNAEIRRGDKVDVETRHRVRVVENVWDNMKEKEIRRSETILFDEENIDVLFNTIRCWRKNDGNRHEQKHAGQLLATIDRAMAASVVLMRSRRSDLSQLLSQGQENKDGQKDDRNDSVKNDLECVEIIIEKDQRWNDALTGRWNIVEDSDG